ncbi:Agamous-like MADS-box protein AGL8 [Zea mays]|uniref:Agamous-like MADS-box protein AGL8 n=1 Tax=Zea mays TaxID=4577 RepID=A0A1D6L4V5_MAIZE|nr:Agamous-like MADS-box protein AGL8 [Zea mays]
MHCYRRRSHCRRRTRFCRRSSRRSRKTSGSKCNGTKLNSRPVRLPRPSC